MMISGVSAAQGRSYAAAANNGKNDTGKVEEEIKRLEQKIKDVDSSFDSPNAKKMKKQELEGQVQKKQAELQQAAQSNSNNNVASVNDDGNSTNDVQSSGLGIGAIDIKI